MKLEQKLKELEEIVKKLEAGECDLDESISLFEKGINLSRSCQKLLDDAENKVSVLINDNGSVMSKKDFADLKED